MDAGPVLEITRLNTVFRIGGRRIAAVRDLDLTIAPGETVALVGESGSGKSVTSLSIMGLLPKGIGEVESGRLLLRRKSGEVVDLRGLSREALRRIRG